MPRSDREPPGSAGTDCVSPDPLGPDRVQPDLIRHLACFGRALRERGAGVTLSDEADGLAALTLVDLADRDEVRRALSTALKIRPRDRAAFEQLFERLWAAQNEPEGPSPPAHPSFVDPTQPPRRPPAPREQPANHGPARPAAPRASLLSGPGADETALADGEEPGYSPEAVLRRKSFEAYSPADQQAMERLLERLVPRLATHPSRRRVPVRGRGEPDLRRSFRRAAAQGGEFLSLARRARAVEQPRLVVLCDTSGSMDPHSRFLLTFILGLRRVAGWGRSCEIFAFNTALVRLTPLLRMVKAVRTVRTARTAPTVRAAPTVPGEALAPGASFADLDPVLERLAAAVPDWSGGTRIGECLAEFAAHHLDQRVDANTVVLILSDGLDRGDVEPLAWAMRAIRARARRVLWLNPLAGDARYEPSARAMAAALPHIDRLLPAHNLESLERLLPLLSA
jgi:uncharacterized protein with von Willebrand factor type A (vWA) domain